MYDVKFFLVSAVIILLMGIGIPYLMKPSAEFYIDGQGYYTHERCINSITTTEYRMHYGYYMGKFQMHYGPVTTTECIDSVLDTLKVE